MAIGTSSRYTLYITVIFSCISFAIVLPSLWPYLQTLHANKAFLASVVAIFSFGEALGAIFFGFLTSTHTARHVLMLTAAFGTLGSLFYSSAPLLPAGHGQYAVLLGRFLHGTWSGGAQAVEQTYFAKMLPRDELTAATVTLTSCATLGFMLGPAMGLFGEIVSPFPIFMALEYNAVTEPGLFVLLSSATSVWLYYRFMDEGEDERLTERGAVDEERALLDKSEAMSGELIVGLIVCNVGFFAYFFAFALLETITTPLAQAFYSWSLGTVNLLFTATGVCSFGAFFAVIALSSRFSDYSLTNVSLVMSLVASCLMMSRIEDGLAMWRFLSGFGLTMISFLMGRATVISMYSKLLPADKQGVGQGILLSTGAVARVVGPFWAVRVFTFALGGIVVFGLTGALFMFTMMTMFIFHKRFER